MLIQMIRSLIARILYSIGILQLLLYVRLRHRAIVLMYHRVVSKKNLDKIFSHPGIVIETETFEKHLQVLHRYFHILSLHEFRERMVTGQPFNNRTCLITFDDGWEDNFSEAFPLLERYDLPGVIFLPVGFIGTGKRFWQESLTHLLFRMLELANDGDNSDHRAVFARLRLDLASLSPDEADKARIQDKVSQLKALSEKERTDLLADIRVMLSSQPNTLDHLDTFLTWEQVRGLAANQIQFGSHTVNHNILTNIPLDQVQEEIRSSKVAIEKELGKPIIAFSYPNGNYNTRIREIVIANSYQLAFTTEPGLVSVDDDPYKIKRVNIHQGTASTIPLFLARIIGMV